MRGADAISVLYQRIFAGPVGVRVEFSDAIAYPISEMDVFAGRERGSYERDGQMPPLDIRSWRIFVYALGQDWRQVHHHGSIDASGQPAHYQRAVLGS